MAAKTKTPKRTNRSSFQDDLAPMAVAKSEIGDQQLQQKTRRVLLIVLLLLLLGLFWYRTNSWPLVAVVNYQPIWSWQLNELMYKQVGEQALDNLITEQLIAEELDKKDIEVKDEEINAKIEDIKKQIGSDEAFKQALTVQGMSEDQLKEQIKLQIGLEKLVGPSTDSAKLQEEVYAKVQELRGQQKVWMVPRSQ